MAARRPFALGQGHTRTSSPEVLAALAVAREAPQGLEVQAVQADNHTELEVPVGYQLEYPVGYLPLAVHRGSAQGLSCRKSTEISATSAARSSGIDNCLSVQVGIASIGWDGLL
jgi:hypothetical protein